MKNFHTDFYVLIELHELNQFKIRVIRLIVESLQSICVEIFSMRLVKQIELS
jgi:hypothetical protein